MTTRFSRDYARQLHDSQEARRGQDRAADHQFACNGLPRFVSAGNLDFDDVPIVQPSEVVVPIRESDVLASVMQALRLHPRVQWIERMNGGKFQLPGKNGKPQWVRFGFKGMADITGQLVTGERLEVEVKAPGARTDPKRLADQLAFLDVVARAGGKAFVATSVDDVWRELA